MLPQYANDKSFAARFKQEAQAAAALQSPYIVSVYDWGRDSDTYYIIMEYLRGTDLKSGIRKHGALDCRKVAQIGSQIAQALSVAHRHDIIHRDIKPQNIMVQPDGNIKVMDFGIARAKNSHLTADNSVLGTAHYVSPEQTQGKDLGATTDIYSLGIVMYEMLTGQVPFDADNPVSVALMHINEPITPPSKLVDGIPPGLEKIVMKATDKFQSNRFKSAEELIEALDDIDLVSRVVGNSVFMGSEQKPNVKPVQSDPYIYDEEEVQVPRETVPPAVAAAKKRRKRRNRR
jgi:serine/threonine-protein kinase